MMDKNRDEIAPHKSKFVKQVVYYFIVVVLQIRYGGEFEYFIL